MAPVLVLYGSQTGNSREIAKEVCAEALSRGHQSRVLGMERFKDIDFCASEFVVLVVSSTGNGDAPDNADKFYRYCKRKTTPPVFTNVPFAVVSLGDSNYEQFCEVGRQFDKHLERLGGARALKRCDVDEVEGIETFVEPWKQKLWDALDAAAADLANGGAPNGDEVLLTDSATSTGGAAAAAAPEAPPAVDVSAAQPALTPEAPAVQAAA